MSSTNQQSGKENGVSLPLRGAKKGKEMPAPWTTKQMLQASSVMVGAIGALYLAALYGPLALPAEFLFDLVLWPVDGTQKFDTTSTRLLLGTLGAVIMLAAFFVHSLVSNFHDAHPSLVEKTIMTGVIGWYIVESIMSLALGLPVNLLLNIGFAGMFVAPILLGRRKT